MAEYEACWLMGFPIINLWGARFTSICILCIFCYGWMDCRDTFHAVLCLYCCVMNKKKLSTKYTGLSVFQKLILEAHISYSFLQRVGLHGFQTKKKCTFEQKLTCA